MSNCWAMMLTSLLLAGSMPALRSPAYSSASLPKPHEPTFLPFRSSGLVMFLSLNETWSVGERWKIWPMTTPSAPDSRGASIRGTQLMPNSAWPPATTVAGHDLDRAGQDRDVEALVPVVALVEGREVARELGLREPLELELDRLQHGQAGDWARTDAPPLLEQAASTSIDDDERRDDAEVAHGHTSSYGPQPGAGPPPPTSQSSERRTPPIRASATRPGAASGVSSTRSSSAPRA